jgi:hypothetical protein
VEGNSFSRIAKIAEIAKIETKIAPLALRASLRRKEGLYEVHLSARLRSPCFLRSRRARR